MLNRWLGTTIRFFTLMTMAAVITACGGGGGGSDGGGFLGPDTSPTYTLTLQSFDAAGNPSTSLSRATPLTIVATLKEDNKPLAGEAVALATAVGIVSPDNGSALTDENGQATFVVSYDGVVGAGEVAASFTKAGETADATLAIQSADIGAPFALEIKTTAPNGVASRAFSELSPLQIEATLLDVTGAQPVPVEGAVLALASTIGAVSPENGSTLTDSSGKAMFTLSSDGTFGAGVINLRYEPTDSDPIERSTNIESKAEAEFYTLSLETLAPNGAATQSFTSDEPLTVRVTLASTEASVAGQLISLTSTLGVIAPSNGQALTDTRGVAVFELAAGTEIGAGVVSAVFSGQLGQIEASANVQRLAAEVNRGLLIQLFGVDGSARSTFSEDEPLTVRVSIVDADGDLVDIDGEIIDLSATIGAVSPENGRKLTVDGVAEFQLNFNDIVGAGEVSASYALPEGTLIQTANVEAFSVNANYVLSMVKSGGNARGQITPTRPVTVRVQLLDGVGGAPVAGEIIKLSTAIADTDPRNGEAVTNSSGIAEFELQYSGVDGAGVVTAEYLSEDDVLFSNSLNIESIEQLPPYRLSFSRLDGLGASLSEFNANTPLLITVRLTDDFGRAIAGERITLDSTVGAVEPANGAAVTDSQGQADFSLLGTGTTGAGAVIARYEGELGEVTATVNAQEVTTPSDYTIQITDVGGGVITEGSPIVVTVQLASPNNDIAGQVIRLTSEVGSIDPQNGASLTNANGIATFTLSYNDVVGAGIVTASFDAPDGSVSDFAGVQATAAGFDTGLAIASVDSLGSPTNQLSSTSPLTVRVALVDAAGNVINIDNEIITLSSSVGTVTPASGSALTNNGVAEFIVSANGTLGAGVVTASYSVGGVSVVENYTVQVVSGDLYTLSIQSSGGNLSASSPLTITVTLEDDSGVAQAGEIVTATSSLGNLVAGSAVTNASGQAQFNLEYNGEIGAGLFVANFVTPDGTISNSINVTSVDSPPPYLLQIVSLADLDGNPTNQFSSQSPLIVTVALLETDGTTPVANSVVGLTSTLGTVSPSNGTALTDLNGRASFTITGTGETGAGVIVASYGSGDSVLTVQRNVQAVEDAPLYTIEIAQTLDPSDAASNEFSSSSPLTVIVKLESSGGIPLENRPISLVLSGLASTILPNNSVAVTDSNGEAEFELQYAGETGGGELQATYAGPAGDVLATKFVSAVIADLDIGGLDDAGSFQNNLRALPTSSVSYLGSVQLLVAVVDSNGSPISTTESVSFESPCLLNGFSQLDTGLTTEVIDGILSVTYTAGENCSAGPDNVTATLIQEGIATPKQASVTLTIGAAPAANERFITFVNANPVNMALRGTGGGTTLSETSLVTFEVRDGSGRPVSGEEVTFSLSTEAGGLELADADAVTGETIVTTDTNGQASVTLFSGSIPVPVRVIATIERSPDDADANLISAVSDELSISAGIATQARFDVVAEVLNPPNAAVVDGITVNITASAYDRFGNPVPDGTTVNFTSECGGVGAGGPTGACQTQTGRCSVEWVSQPGSFDTCDENRVTILGHLLGEEAFFDEDSDGYHSARPSGAGACSTGVSVLDTECFVDNTEAWRDDDEDGSYDAASEAYIDIDNGLGSRNGEWDAETPTDANPEPALGVTGVFNGLACRDESGNTCSSQLISVFANLELVAGPSDAGVLTAQLYESSDTGFLNPLDPNDPADSLLGGSYVLRLWADDAVQNIPPLGTTLTATGYGECEVVSPDSTVPNSSDKQPHRFAITIRTETNDADTDDYIEIKWAIPDGTGNESQLIFGCIPSAPVAPTNVTATAGVEEATVTFTASPGAVSSYTATSNSGETGSCTSSPCTVTGLTGGVAYTFTVTATNPAGTSPPSAASGSVTPTAAP